MGKMFSFVRGLFWGAVISSALVLLFTPYSGEELQSRAKDYLENVQDEVKEAGDEKRRELEEELAFLRTG